MSGRQKVVVFDLGGVLVDWDPRNLYRKLLAEDDVEPFLATVCTQEWNEHQDAGRSASEAIAQLSEKHPDKASLIAAYYDRFSEMIAGLIDENLALADELIGRGVMLHALTNWSADTFSVLDDYDLLSRFGSRVLVSGREGVKKPDPAIYALFTERFSKRPSDLLFIDDSAANVAAARASGWSAVRYVPGTSVRQSVLTWLEA